MAFALLSLAVNAETVYVCTGPKAKRYHKTGACMGLGSCSKEIVAVDRTTAENRGKTPCKVCYKGKGPRNTVRHVTVYTKSHSKRVKYSR